MDEEEVDGVGRRRGRGGAEWGGMSRRGEAPLFAGFLISCDEVCVLAMCVCFGFWSTEFSLIRVTFMSMSL